MKKRKISKLNRVLSSLLAVCLFVPLLLVSNVEVVHADSNDLRKTFIELMSGKRTIQATDISKLTNKDLQSMAVYLSNFYVPYNTSLDGSNNDSTIAGMTDALKKTGFSQDTAETFVDLIFQCSLSSAKQLYICEDDFSKYQLVGVDSDNGEKIIDYTQEDSSYSFGFSSATDNSNREPNADPGIRPFDKVTDKYDTGLRTANYVKNVGDNVSYGGKTFTPLTIWIYEVILKDKSQGYLPSTQTVSLYWGDSSEMTKCFEFNDITMSQIETFTEKLSASNGKVGNSVLSTSIDRFTSLSTVDKPKMTTITQKMYIDWAGNLIADFGSERVIMFPGCINPYTFGKLEDSAANPVARWNIISTWGAYCLSESNTGTTVNKGASGTGSFTLHQNTLPIDYYWFRGSNDKLSGQPWDNDMGFGKGSADYIRTFFKENGFKTGGNDYWGTTSYNLNSKDNFTIDASNSVHNFLVYLTLASQTSLSDDSNFAKSEALPEPSGSLIVNQCFTNDVKFSVMSDDWTSFMSFDGGKQSGEYIMLSNFLITYVFAFANHDKAADAPDTYVDMKYMDVFPTVLDQAIVFDEATSKADQEKITSYINYLLSPSEGVAYFVRLVKNKLGGLLVGWHEDIVGGTDSNSTTGMTKYLSTSGYVTTPNLYEFEWLNSLLENYNSIVVYLIIAMAIILMCYILIGSMTLSRAVVGLMLFAFLAFIPPIAINTTTDLINTMNDTMYSKKFDYWAYTQLHTYIDKLQTVNSAYTMTDYVSSMLDLQMTEADVVGGYSGVRVKWMTPKKFTDIGSAQNELEENLSNTFSSAMIDMLGNVLATTHSAEDYKDCVGQTYLYRDFMDIYTYGSQSYNVYRTYNYANQVGNLNHTELGEGFSEESDSIVRAIHFYEDVSYSSGMNLGKFLSANNTKTFGNSGGVFEDTSSLTHTDRGFLVDTGVDEFGNGDVSSIDCTHANYFNRQRLALAYPVVFYDTFKEVSNNYNKLYDTLYNSDGSIKTDSNVNVTRGLRDESTVYGLAPDEFSYTLKELQSCHDKTFDGTTKKRMSGLFYALYCESPYYFFNNNIRDQLVNFGAGFDYSYDPDNLTNSTGHLYKMLLNNKQQYFFNLTENAGDGYGELRDFMNMHDFFYYIMPMMQMGNDTVNLWDDVFGMYTYDDCNLTILENGKIRYGGVTYGTLNSDTNVCDNALSELVKSYIWTGNKNEQYYELSEEEKENLSIITDEQKYKIWHNYNVWCLFNQYCTWLDTMEDCNYAKDEFISVMGERFHVLNPLDPTSYFTEENGEMTAGRYMVFSRSEMEYYGLDIADLTTVEQKIIQCQDNVYKQTLDLMNYYTLADEVLINAYAMIETFEFNKIFSQSSIIGNDYMMYPQGYEAKAFSYDAYLRLIMSEASGEPIQVDSNTGETSIYRRIIKNTSIFYGVFLLFNDIISVYCIPLLRVAFLIMIFFISIALIIAASIKLELNLLTVVWKSIFAPLMSYAVVSLSFAFLVSLFMSNGADKVVKTELTINLGDPTMCLIVMIVINIAFMILYFKICKKCFRDLKTYFESIAASISSTVVGAASAVMGGLMAGKRGIQGVNSAVRHGLGAVGDGINTVARVASQRGKDNMPEYGHFGMSGVTGGMAAGALSAGVLAGMSSSGGSSNLAPTVQKRLEKQAQREEAAIGMNKYTRKAMDKVNTKADKAEAKAIRHRNIAEGKSGISAKYHNWKAGTLNNKQKMYDEMATNIKGNSAVVAAVKNTGSRIKYLSNQGNDAGGTNARNRFVATKNASHPLRSGSAVAKEKNSMNAYNNRMNANSLVMQKAKNRVNVARS